MLFNSILEYFFGELSSIYQQSSHKYSKALRPSYMRPIHSKSLCNKTFVFSLSAKQLLSISRSFVKALHLSFFSRECAIFCFIARPLYSMIMPNRFKASSVMIIPFAANEASSATSSETVRPDNVRGRTRLR